MKPWIVKWCGNDRVFGSYMTKDAARAAVDNFLAGDTSYCLQDFSLTYTGSGEFADV